MRSALWAMFAVLALSSASCAGGTDDDAPGGAGGMGAGAAGASGAAGAGSCGNGIIESAASEQCEPTMAVPTNCRALGMGDGMVVCTQQCRLMMMCTGVSQPVGGDGNGGGTGLGGTQG